MVFLVFKCYNFFMLSTKNLILNLNFEPREIAVKKEDVFDFNNKKKLTYYYQEK